VPRLPLLPDPLRRIKVPSDLSAITTVSPEEEDGAAAGLRPDGVERIWRNVESLFRTGVHPAIALCVRREGQVVLDRAIGWARGGGPNDGPDAQRELATPWTPFVIFSAAKAMTATVAHLLDERGLIHIDDRVIEYIPEYGKHGKDAITIEHVLSHRAGVPNLPGEVLQLENIDNTDLILETMCDAKPSTRPGKLLAYHAVSGGFIIGEIVRRVTGKDIREVLAEEILEPLGFRWGNFGVAPEDVERVGLSYATGPRPLPPVSTILKRALGLPPDEVTRTSNDPRFLTGIVPAANVVTTANELSRFYELLRCGGELDGIRVMEPRTIRRATVERAYREIDLTLGAPLRHASGFMLGADLLSLFGPDTELAFGHLGFTNVLGWADPERALSVGLITSGKPILHPGLPDLWQLTRRIGLEARKVDKPALRIQETSPTG
jgi:CubicO group peptidase (beta-lactamase class C family)